MTPQPGIPCAWLIVYGAGHKVAMTDHTAAINAAARLHGVLYPLTVQEPPKP